MEGSYVTVFFLAALIIWRVRNGVNININVCHKTENSLPLSPGFIPLPDNDEEQQPKVTMDNVIQTLNEVMGVNIDNGNDR